MNSNVKTAIFWVVLICVAVLLWTVVKHGKNKPPANLTFSQFLYQVESGKVKKVYPKVSVETHARDILADLEG